MEFFQWELEIPITLSAAFRNPMGSIKIYLHAAPFAPTRVITNAISFAFDCK